MQCFSLLKRGTGKGKIWDGFKIRREKKEERSGTFHRTRLPARRGEGSLEGGTKRPSDQG